mgnify:CR=1 FL=1
MFTFELPEIGEGVIEGEVVAWLVDVGAHVDVDQPLATTVHSAARANLPAWLASHSTSPLTNEALPHKMVVPNHALKALIWGFKDP